MKKVRVYYSNGTIMTSSPMNRPDAIAFQKKFKADDDVIYVEELDMLKPEAQAEFRASAAMWRGRIESTRGTDRFDPATDKIMHHHYIDHFRLGTCG